MGDLSQSCARLFFSILVGINLLLMVFNLIPLIPLIPLDGHYILPYITLI